jgi:hypothetical protein
MSGPNFDDRSATTRSAIFTRRRSLQFLPSYSPDFNPIEKAFARLKAMLRKAAERTVSGLWALFGKLVDIFRPAECANYFTSCGYDPDRSESAPASAVASAPLPPRTAPACGR